MGQGTRAGWRIRFVPLPHALQEGPQSSGIETGIPQVLGGQFVCFDLVFVPDSFPKSREIARWYLLGRRRKQRVRKLRGTRFQLAQACDVFRAVPRCEVPDLVASTPASSDSLATVRNRSSST